MPRNASGTYSLPTGNPVVSGNVIEASWANSTLNDLATEMTNSLSRAGAGGMTGALRLADGTSSVPGLAWGSETGTGWYRAGTNDVRFVVATNEVQRWTASGTSVTGTLTASGQVRGGGSSGAQFLGNDVNYAGSRVFFATSADANQRINVGHYDSSTLSFPTGLVPAQILAGVSNLHIATRDVAGASIVFRSGPGVPEVVRIDSSGNLGIGTSSPGAKLEVNGDIKSNKFEFNNEGAGSLYLTTGYLRFSNAGGETMRLDSSGNLGLGGTGTNPSGLGGRSFTVNTTGTNYGGIEFSRDGNYIGALRIKDGSSDNNLVLINNTASALIFGTNNNERVRIDASGNLLLGTTSNANNYKAFFQGTGSSAVLGLFAMNATTPYGINIYYGAAAPNNSNANTAFLYCNDTVGLKLQLNSNGGIQNFQANNTNLSDRREKTNFAPAKDYLDTICAIPVQTFNYIDQAEDDPGKTLGVVAQDVQAVAPELVHESNWGSEDEPKMRLSIYQTDLQYALMKALQELKTELDVAKARIAALEAA